MKNPTHVTCVESLTPGSLALKNIEKSTPVRNLSYVTFVEHHSLIMRGWLCIKKIHSGEKSYFCDICEKQYSTLANLVTHKKKHNDEKTYSCDKCHKALSSSDSLIKHKRIHSYQFICDSCKDSFTTMSALIRHQKIHPGMQAHQCELCQKSFYSKNDLFIHNNSYQHLKKFKSTVKTGASSSTGFLKIAETDDIQDINGEKNIKENLVTITIEDGKKEETIKQEIKKEKFDEDCFTIEIEADNIEGTIKQEIKEEKILVEDSLSIKIEAVESENNEF